MTARGRGEAGFTLIELSMVVALMSVVGVLSLTALTQYRENLSQQQTADALVSDLRSTAQKAVAEGRTYCLYVDDGGDSWTAYRSSCASASTVVDPEQKAERPATLSGLSIATPTTAACPSTGACIYFYPRGTATKSSIDVARVGKPSVTVTVEGLTSRVDRT